MKHLSTIATTLMLVCGMAYMGIASSAGTESWSRFDPNLPSNSGDFVGPNCGGKFDGSDFPGQVPATATIQSTTTMGQTTSVVKIKNARPHTHYTMWIRLKGKSHGTDIGNGNGFPIGGSPVTNGGATPYAPSSELTALIDDWAGVNAPVGCIPPGTAIGGAAGINCSSARANGFVTDMNGRGSVAVNADFYSVAGGAYPFNRMSPASLAIAVAKTGNSTADPTAIADPRDPNITSTPFLYRMVSHCLDDASHGLSPAKRETWFDFP